MALNPTSLPVVHKKLDIIPLEEIQKVLTEGLPTNFKDVEVTVVDCPDLTKEPFTLAKPGLSGSTKLVEVGGPPYLLPTVQKDKVYDLRDIAKLSDAKNVFIIGAGAGPHPYAGRNCEGIFNLVLENGTVNQQTRIAKVTPVNENCSQEILPNTETRMALLGNLFLSEGKPGKVLKVHAKTRTGRKDFIASIRECLEKKFPDKLVGLGGTFLLKEGIAKQHVMRDFSTTPIKNEEELNKWLKFYNMSAPLIAVGTLVNGDGGLDLRVQHFHSFSNHGEAGHYHIDVTPETVEYLGYFSVGEEIYRIDAPEETHTFGRD
ncbi:ester hydrolase C11orf54 homolog isoform X2 [Coccinella septempunctata]|nr:ester hydrolase C11orf54 homolog isoform X2 [Coccinella septempunctata]